ALRPHWERPLTAETRRIIDDAATAGLILIDLDRARAGKSAACDRPHCHAVKIIALRQVLDGDVSHGNLLAANYRRWAPEAEARGEAIDCSRMDLRSVGRWKEIRQRGPWRSPL